MKPEPALKRIDAAEMPEDIASAWEASMALRGDATFFEVFANHPDLYRWYVGSFYGEVFRGGTVAQPYKELLRLRLSTLHGCRFCNQGNRRDALAAGLTEAQEKYERPASLGEIEITVTPRMRPGPEMIDRYNELGVDRLVLLSGARTVDESLTFIEHIHDTLLS